ncbi:hypothetical protein L596_013410 [Steinernema carpocapsae]|uniref:Uncharacterized protein n=1 Tax=Steinernema carpocapsae TaxID=34508 RepID=A0A4U5P0Q5_STECR|nr:hypothetical protein L596_013410 [Steinernema carpocapsae]
MLCGCAFIFLIALGFATEADAVKCNCRLGFCNFLQNECDGKYCIIANYKHWPLTLQKCTDWDFQEDGCYEFDSDAWFAPKRACFCKEDYCNTRQLLDGKAIKSDSVAYKGGSGHTHKHDHEHDHDYDHDHDHEHDHDHDHDHDQDHDHDHDHDHDQDHDHDDDTDHELDRKDDNKDELDEEDHHMPGKRNRTQQAPAPSPSASDHFDNFVVVFKPTSDLGSFDGYHPDLSDWEENLGETSGPLVPIGSSHGSIKVKGGGYEGGSSESVGHYQPSDATATPKWEFHFSTQTATNPTSKGLGGWSSFTRILAPDQSGTTPSYRPQMTTPRPQATTTSNISSNSTSTQRSSTTPNFMPLITTVPTPYPPPVPINSKDPMKRAIWDPTYTDSTSNPVNPNYQDPSLNIVNIEVAIRNDMTWIIVLLFCCLVVLILILALIAFMAYRFRAKLAHLFAHLKHSKSVPVQTISPVTHLQGQKPEPLFIHRTAPPPYEKV